ncbi:MAG: hypothetical protein JO121_30315 [Deltaproteobacteria bacterium]|jgi:pseudouridine-5'-phosphate glycosidase|nr:hypothetical protein [Deltaproteobacteria bacterium]
MSASITETVKRQQLSAMGTGRFAVRVMRRNYRMVLRRDQNETATVSFTVFVTPMLIQTTY